MDKYSFKTSWVGDLDGKFKAELLLNGEIIESEEFDYQDEMFKYIADTMCSLQIAGEDWSFTY